MAEPTIAEIIQDRVNRLPIADQRRVLEYVESSKPLKGVTGESLLEFAGAISLEDLEVMKRAIEDG